MAGVPGQNLYKLRHIGGFSVAVNRMRKKATVPSPVTRLDVFTGCPPHMDFVGYLSYAVVEGYKRIHPTGYKLYGRVLLVVDAFSREPGWIVDFLKDLANDLSRVQGLKPLVSMALIHPQHLVPEEEDRAREELLNYFSPGAKTRYWVKAQKVGSRIISMTKEIVIVEDLRAVLPLWKKPKVEGYHLLTGLIYNT